MSNWDGTMILLDLFGDLFAAAFSSFGTFGVFLILRCMLGCMVWCCIC
jgi:hypothetical protein